MIHIIKCSDGYIVLSNSGNAQFNKNGESVENAICGTVIEISNSKEFNWTDWQYTDMYDYVYPAS
jgi:hypothetical protein